MNDFPKDPCQAGVTMSSFCISSWVASGKCFNASTLLPEHSYKEAQLIILVCTWCNSGNEHTRLFAVFPSEPQELILMDNMKTLRLYRSVGCFQNDYFVKHWFI